MQLGRIKNYCNNHQYSVILFIRYQAETNEKARVTQENNEDYEQYKSEAETYDKRIAELEAY